MAATEDLIHRISGRMGRVPGLAAASVVLYGGTLGFYASGYVTNVTATGANAFAGVIVDRVDNASGAAGDLPVELYHGDMSIWLNTSVITQAHVGLPAYAVDNDTVSNVATNNVKIGTIREVKNGRVLVQLDVSPQSA